MPKKPPDTIATADERVIQRLGHQQADEMSGQDEDDADVEQVARQAHAVV
jgi:hypothetical protein